MRSKVRIAAACVWLFLATLAGGCATVPAPAPGTVSSPMPGREPEPVHPRPGSAGTTAASPAPSPTPTTSIPMGTTASGGIITQTGPAVAAGDSLPSADAQAVLRTIPDPISPGEAAHGETVMHSAAPDTMAAAASPDSAAAPRDSADVPIPALTQPLGDRPGARSLTDSLAATGPPGTAQAGPSAGTGDTGASPGAGAKGGAVSPDSCWRVQVAAVPEPTRAAALRDAAQSQLWTTMVIQTEKKLHKVRTRDCLTAEAAERLKQRAIAAGFKGAFRFQPPR
jgi:hypothetical protein